MCALGMLAYAASALAEEAKFTYTGAEQQFIVPAGVFSVNIVAIGSEGESSSSGSPGGVGAVVSGTLPVTPEQVPYGVCSCLLPPAPPRRPSRWSPRP